MGYLGYIDGLRAIAVLIILAFHLDAVWMPGGFIGVDIFFVISGYLITRLITDDIKTGTFSFAQFYARRIKRIFPALFVMLIFATIAALLMLGMEPYNNFFRSMRGTALQIGNIYFNRNVDYFTPQEHLAPLLHTWSLGVEEQFYALWPLLLVLLHKCRKATLWRVSLALIFITSLATSVYLVETDPKSAFYLLHARAWELALGGLVCLTPLYFKKTILNMTSVAGLALILIPAFQYTPANFPGINALWPCLGTALLLYAGQDMNPAIRRFLTLRPLISIGIISYSLYLWHWPVITFYKLYQGETLTLTVQLSLLAASLICATLSYRFVEQPFRHLKTAPYKVITVGILIMVTFFGVGHFFKRFNESSWRISYQMDPLESKPHDLDGICSVDGGPYNVERCIIGPNPDRYEVIMAGDSTASHYLPMVLGWAKEKGLTVRLFSRAACPTWLKNESPYRFGRLDKSCIQLTRDFYNTLENDKHIRYIFIAMNMPFVTAETAASFEDLKSFNMPVHMLGMGMRFETSPLLCIMRKNLWLAKLLPSKDNEKDCFTPHPELHTRYQRNTHAFVNLLQEHGFSYFDPLPHQQTPYDAQGKLMFLDDYHMNIYGSTHLIPAFTNYMKAHDNQ